MAEIDVLLLRLDAPLMSFGGILVDQHGVTQRWPGVSLLTGMLANALGYDHREAGRLERLQERLRVAVREDRPGTPLVDYQTVDLSQPHMQETWTTSGAPASRGGGSAGGGTHIRYRHYWAGAIYTVALTLVPEPEAPGLADCARALAEPERPLFLGRKACLPSAPVVLRLLRAPSLLHAVRETALPKAIQERREDTTSLQTRTGDSVGEHQGPAPSFSAWWPGNEPVPPWVVGARQQPVYDNRDWHNRVHTGRRIVWEGLIPAPAGGTP